VRRAAAELVPAGLARVPVPLPWAPGPPRRLAAEPRIAPALASVGADLDTLHRAIARPGATGDRVRAGLERALAGGEVGDPGRDHQRARKHPRNRLAVLVGRLPEAITARLLIPLERLVEHGDALDPFHARHPVPPGDDQSQR